MKNKSNQCVPTGGIIPMLIVACDSVIVGKGNLGLEDAIAFIHLQTKTIPVFDTTTATADFTLNSKAVTISSVSMAASNITIAGNTITINSGPGDWVADGFEAGMSVKLINTVNNTDKVFIIEQATSVDLDVTSSISAEVGTAGVTAIGSPLSPALQDLEQELYLVEGTRYIPIKLMNGIDGYMFTDWVDATANVTTWALVAPIFHNILLTDAVYDLTASVNAPLFTNWYSSVGSKILGHNAISFQSNSSIGTCYFKNINFEVDEYTDNSKGCFYLDPQQHEYSRFILDDCKFKSVGSSIDAVYGSTIAVASRSMGEFLTRNSEYEGNYDTHYISAVSRVVSLNDTFRVSKGSFASTRQATNDGGCIQTGAGAVFLTRNIELVIKNPTIETDNYQANGWQAINIQVPAASTFTYKGEITGGRIRVTDHSSGGATVAGIRIDSASPATYEMLIDNNSFDVTSNGGTDEDIIATSDITAQLTIGRGNRKVSNAGLADIVNVTQAAA